MPRSLAIAGAELGSRLSGQPDLATTPVCVALPPHFDARSLPHVLGLLRAITPRVAAFVDAAALTAAALQLRGAVVVLDVGLHHAGATRVEGSASEVRRRSAEVRRSGGLESVHEAWLQLVSEAMVLRTRFDPLHEAATEQRLFNVLGVLAAQASAEGSATVSLPVGNERFEVQLSRDQFAARAAPFYRDLVAMVHELRPAGMALTLVVPEHASALPGLREALAEFRGCELVVAPRGCAAVAASRFVTDDAPALGAVRWLRGVPRFAEPQYPADERPVPLALGGGDDPASRPTHVLWSGRAIALAGRAVEIGRAPQAGGVQLPDGLAGVSRLHCTLRDEGEALVLIDHSRYGTLVNGERVSGRARLRAGDVVRIGDPGIELSLMSVGS